MTTLVCLRSNSALVGGASPPSCEGFLMRGRRREGSGSDVLQCDEIEEDVPKDARRQCKPKS